ncbi:MAG: Spy/CpxP family protein refolding chaperone [Pseudomonadota bacterium]|nr:Spy/CpxP family protein refolding chaperone [Pseudomonadota bacterium]
MTITRKQAIAAALLAAAAGFASAQSTPAPAPQGTPAAGEAKARPASERGARQDPAQRQQRMAERQAQRMTELKAQLHITPAQESAWNSFAAAMQPQPRGERPSRGDFEKLTTPERIDRMQALHAERAAQMTARGNATKAFYAQLTPEQQKTFDARAMRASHGEGKRGHGRGGHGPR